MNTPGRSVSRFRVHPLVLGVLLLAMAVGLTAPTTSADAHVEAVSRSDPARGAVVTAVSAITIEFTDTIRTEVATFTLRSSDGVDHLLAAPAFGDDDTTVRLGPPESAELPEGLYRVGYQLVFSDGHPATGVIQFEVSRTGVAQAAPWPKDDPAPVRAPPERFDIAGQLPWLVGGAVVLVAGFGWFLRRMRRTGAQSPGPSDT